MAWSCTICAVCRVTERNEVCQRQQGRNGVGLGRLPLHKLTRRDIHACRYRPHKAVK